MFKEYILKELKRLGVKDINLDIPPDPKLGDFSLPCFPLAKAVKKDPKSIAEQLAKEFKKNNLIAEVKTVGPYLNFYVNKSIKTEETIKKILKEKEHYGKAKNKGTIMVEYVSPNTNKALHLGHVRNAMLGIAVSNILESQGYKVIRSCINNDRGVGVTEAMLGYKMFFKDKTPKEKPDHFVAECYVAFKKALKENESLKNDVQDLLLRWEHGDKEALALWKKMMAWVYKGYEETYRRLGIKFDKQYYESDFYMEGKDIVMKGLENGIFEKEDGAIIAKLKKYGLPDKVLIKSDGTSLYMTQDLYLAKKKFDDFDIDSSIYVVASEQDNHFRQLFKILELLEFKFAKGCHHLSYGLVNLPSGRMKSREGTVVDADDLMDEVVNIAEKETVSRHKELKEKELKARAGSIGLGALKFFMLKFDPVNSFVYNPEESLSFEGETGPYIQYTHARLCSILRKAKKYALPKDLMLDEEKEVRIIGLLSRFPETLEAASNNYRPSVLCRYLLDIAQATNEYYHSTPILDSDEQGSRLALIDSIRIVLKAGLNLLGIDAPEEM